MEKLTEKLTIRVDGSLHARVERHCRRLEEQAGCRLSRGEMARKLLVAGLDALEPGLNSAEMSAKSTK